MPTASEIIERVKARYAGCRTYQDEGEQTSVIVHGTAPWHRKTERRHFRTAFCRPEHYFFDSYEVEVGPESEWPRVVVWANSKGAWSWEITKHLAGGDPQLSSGTLQHVTGPGAQWASTMIPKLLLPTLTYRGLPESEHVSMDGTAMTDGVECFKIMPPRDPRWDPMTFWIQCDTWYVRRIDTRLNMTSAFVREMNEHVLARLEDFPPHMRDDIFNSRRSRSNLQREDYFVDTTTVWHPHMDHDIDPKVFEFVPPG